MCEVKSRTVHRNNIDHQSLKKHILLLHKDLGAGKCELCETLWLDMSMEQVEGQISADVSEVKGTYQTATQIVSTILR
jgi:tRNA A37 threonylcarbamoyladenosine biosynthesis protein TsaE